MKKLIFLFVLLTVAINAQSFNRANYANSGVSWADSLFMTHGDSALYTMPDGSTSASDTSKVYWVNKQFEFLSVTISDTGAFIDDSIKLWCGQIVKDENDTAVDTTWSLALVKDSTLTFVTQPLVDDAAIKTYRVYDPLLASADLIKIEYINEDWVAGRMTKLFWNAVRKLVR